MPRSRMGTNFGSDVAGYFGSEWSPGQTVSFVSGPPQEQQAPPPPPAPPQAVSQSNVTNTVINNMTPGPPPSLPPRIMGAGAQVNHFGWEEQKGWYVV